MEQMGQVKQMDQMNEMDQIEFTDTAVSGIVAAAPADGARAASPRPGNHFHAFGRNVLLKNISETSRLFQMAFFVIVARRFGAPALGSLIVLITIGSAVGLLFGDLGINTTMIARMSGSPEPGRKDVASEALYWKGVLSACTFVLTCAGMVLANRSGSWLEFTAVAVLSLGSLWLEFLCALTDGVNRFVGEVWLRMAYRGIVYGGGCLVALYSNLLSGLVYLGATTILVLAIAFLLVRLYLVPVALRFRPGRGFALLKESVPVWVTQLAQLTYLKFDVVILGLLHVAARETGWYASAWKIADVLTALPTLLAAAVLPLVGGAVPGMNVFLIAPKYLKTMYLLPFLFVLPLSIGAEWITRLLYGAGFAGTPKVLQILAWAVVPIFIHSFLAVVAVATRRQSEAAKLAATTSFLGLLAAVNLVPKFGYETMAVICLVANSLFACAMIYRFRDVTGSAQAATGLKSLGSAMGAYALCSLLPRGVHPVLMIVGGTAAYGAALLVLGVLRARDVNRGWQFLGSVLWNRAAGEMGPA
jgi:O-antigen/teichoic acid export membrane protein